MGIFNIDGKVDRLGFPPRLGPNRLRSLLARRYDIEAELPDHQTALGAMLDGFRVQREDYQEDEWKLTFTNGKYSSPDWILNLYGWDMTATRWCGVDLTSAIAHGVLWDEVDIGNSYDEGKKIRSNCTGMDFSGYQAGEYERTGRRMLFTEVNLYRSCWDGCLVVESLFDRCNFTRALLRGATFYECNLGSCNFTDVNCQGASFIRCDLPGRYPELQRATIQG